MLPETKLLFVKLVHTLIWLFFNVVIFYMLFAAISNRLNGWLWLCYGLVLAEGLVLLIFKRLCPVTIIARRYSNSTRDNFDIFLPNWLAKYNKLIYTSIVIVTIIITAYRLINQQS